MARHKSFAPLECLLIKDFPNTKGVIGHSGLRALAPRAREPGCLAMELSETENIMIQRYVVHVILDTVYVFLYFPPCSTEALENSESIRWAGHPTDNLINQLAFLLTNTYRAY